MELPAVMASLQLQESSNDDNNTNDSTETEVEQNPRRSLRKRVGSLVVASIKRQKVNPISPETLTSEKDIVDYYMKVNKKCSVRQTNLETIFEEPKENGDGNLVTMSGAKVRRSLVFSGRLTKAKKVKRSAKVKKYQLSKGKSMGEKKRKLTVDEVKLKLAALESWQTLFDATE